MHWLLQPTYLPISLRMIGMKPLGIGLTRLLSSYKMFIREISKCIKQ